MPLYPSFPMLRLTVMPPNFGPGSFSTMRHEMPSSVRAASATTPARSPFVTHILVPVMTYSSPSRTARHAMLRVSLPASDSDSDKQPRTSPVASRGSSRRFCSSVPLCTTRYVAIVCVLTMPDNDIQPYASSSTTPMYVSKSSPRPPYSTGIVIPKRPSSFICSTIFSGYSSACSISVATGMTSRAMKRRTVSISSWRVSGSVSSMTNGTLAGRMMDHRTMMGFRRDEALKQRKIDRAVMRRVLVYIRPYRRQLILFVLSVILASVATALSPLLLKGLLDTAIPEKNRTLVFWIAMGAVFLALVNAALSLVQRYYSSIIGEGLIYDLRTELFDHIQRMPIAFFTRTQTGALQSRLNTDVVGAQQAVTNTLGTVLQNFIQIIVTLIVMFSLNWAVTLLTLLALPAFIYPARRLGPRIQQLAREGMQQNAEMNNITAERFNVAGAMLAKLFGRPDRENHEFSARAGRVRDVGIRTAMYSRVLLIALGLVTAVGTAIVYLVGGNLAVSGTLQVGTVAAFVLYVSQLYQPLAQLTNSRVDVLTALVSFERVFEVLDFPPAIDDRPDAVELIDPKGLIAFEHVWF